MNPASLFKKDSYGFLIYADKCPAINILNIDPNNLPNYNLRKDLNKIGWVKFS